MSKPQVRREGLQVILTFNTPQEADQFKLDDQGKIKMLQEGNEALRQMFVLQEMKYEQEATKLREENFYLKQTMYNLGGIVILQKEQLNEMKDEFQIFEEFGTEEDKKEEK